MIKITVYLTEKQIQGLKALAKETGLSYSEHLRRAVDEYLTKLRKERAGD